MLSRSRFAALLVLVAAVAVLLGYRGLGGVTQAANATEIVMPTVTVTGFKIVVPEYKAQGETPPSITVSVEATVTNPNTVAGKLDKIAFSVYDIPSKVGQLICAGEAYDRDLKAGGDTTVKMSVLLKWSEMNATQSEAKKTIDAIHKLYEEKGMVFAWVTGTAWLKVGDSSFQVPVDAPRVSFK